MLVQVLNKAESYLKKENDKKKVEELKNFLLKNIKSLEERGIDVPAEMHRVGVNVYKILLIRIKNEGMS